MPLDFQTPQQAKDYKKWERLSMTEPDQMVDTFNEKHHATPAVRINISFDSCQTDRQDHWQDFSLFLHVVNVRASHNDIHWSRLVDAGVVDSLCSFILRVYSHPPPQAHVTKVILQSQSRILV